MNGEWPPDWDDPDEVIPGQADQPDEEADARLSAVSAYLASVPAPVLPDLVEARISAAIAAEAASRNAAGTGNALPAAAEEAPGPATAARRSRRSSRTRPGRPPRWERPPSGRRDRYRAFLKAAPVLVVCLIVAGLGLALSHGGSQSSGSYESSGSSAAAAAPENSAASGGETPPDAASAPAPFAVTRSGTRYARPDLARQVKAVIAGSAAAGTTVPGARSSAAAGSAAQQLTAPSAQLLGCVQRLTGGGLPKLVDRATYQGTPVYVIASASAVWVVGLGCSATDPQLIVSVALAG
jgi:hypothetical protein